MTPGPTRRQFLAGAGALTLLSLPRRTAAASGPRRLTLRPGGMNLTDRGLSTGIWGYDGQVPGPVLRAPQGSLLEIEAVNGLAEPTTIHWHGLRLPNAMDGVPDLTQAPIAPGASFRYAFPLPDAGTFWYHPHLNTSEQLGRGLYGALIVEEAAPPLVDRELLWVLSDWRLDEQGQVVEDFRNPFDQAHAGRIGSLVSLNDGPAGGSVPVTAGERLRLRLVNAAQARIFALEFEGHAPVVVARDGQPCTPHAPAGNLVRLGPGMRADLILDAAGGPGERFAVLDRQDERRVATLALLAYDAGQVLRESPLEAPAALPPNPLAPPDLQAAAPLRFTFAGGMGAAAHGQEATDHGAGAIWNVNGHAMTHTTPHQGHQPPLVTLDLGRSYILTLANDSDWWHPIHLHGMHLRLLSENGQAVDGTIWADSVLLPPRGQAEAALLADNPGDWMFHCHIIQHQESGMAAVLRVA